MSRPAQLALDLTVAPAMGPDDFLVADCNAEAVGWLDRWPRWPAPALLLCGPPGCGKSHLGTLWRRRSKAVLLRPDQLRAEHLPTLLAGATTAVIDEIDQVAGVPERERALFHLYNLLAQASGHLLGLAERPASLWPLGLADLRSRLLAAPSVSIAPPDDRLLAGMLIKQFADRQLHPGNDVITYLVTHGERSFDGIRKLVAAIDRSALIAQRRITVPLVRSVLAQIADSG